MKKIKILSLVLSVLMLLSSFSVLTVLANSTEFSGDDFENPSNSLLNWNGLNASDIAEDATGNKYYSKSKKGDRITLNPSVWNNETPIEVSFVADNDTHTNPATVGGFKFYYLYSDTANAYLNVAAYKEGSNYGGVTLFNGPVATTDVDGDGDIDKADNANNLELEESEGASFTPDNSNMNRKGWWAYATSTESSGVRYEKLRYKAVYNWDKWDSENKVTITVSVTHYDGSAVTLKHNNPKVTLTYVYHGDAAAKPEYFTIGFENVSGNTCFDELTVKTATVVADEFKADYADVLAIDNPTQSDENNIYAAYNAYKELDINVRAKLTAEKTKLESLIEGFENAYIESFYGDDFDNANYSSIFWDNKISDVVKTDGANSYVSLSGASKKYSFLQKYIDNNTVSGVSFVADSIANINATTPGGFKFYPLMSDNGSAYINIASYYSGGKYYGVTIYNGPVCITDTNADGVIDTSDNSNPLELEAAQGSAFPPVVANNLARSGWWTYASGERYEKLRYTVWYDWSRWDTENTVTLTVNVKNYDGSEVILRDGHSSTVVLDYVYHGEASAKPDKFTIGFENVKGDTFLDEIEIFTSSGLVKEYRDKYSALLNKELSNISKNDIAEIDNAILDFDALNDESKAELADEKSFIELAKSIAYSDSGEFTGDDFEDLSYSEKVWNNYDKMEIIAENADNNHLKVTDKNYLLTPKFIGDNKLPSKVTFNLKAENLQTFTFYPLYNTKTKEYIDVRFQQQNNLILARTFTSPSWLIMSGSRLVSQSTIMSAQTFPYDTPIKFTAEYLWEKWEKYNILMIDYSFTGIVEGEAKTVSVRVSYQLENGEENLYECTIGFLGSGSNIHYVDNLTLETERVASHVRDKFLDTFSGVLAISKNDLSILQKKIVNYALTQFEGFAYNEKKLFTEEELASITAHLDAKSSEASAFEAKYDALFKTFVTNAVPEMSAQLSEALTEYEALSLSDKIHLTEKYIHLCELEVAIASYIPPRAENDFSSFSEDFESGTFDKWDLNKFDSKYYYDNYRIVTDPKNSENKALLYNHSSTSIVVKEALWPIKGKLVNLTFKIRTEEIEPFTPPIIYFNWVDEKNYIGLQILPHYAQIVYAVEGVEGYLAKVLLYNNQQLLLSEWTDVEINVDDRGVIAYNIVSSNEISISGSALINGVNGGRVAIGHARGFTDNFKISKDIYIDDIEASFVKGDWDINKEITEIKPYFDGNVWMEPGDIVTITGESLGDNVSAVEIVRVPDNYTQTVSYLGELKYNSLRGTENSKYMLESTLDGYWDTTTCKTVDIMQKTTASIKFKIPEEFENGIYAVKLISKYYTGDVILYINAPDAAFATGDEGEVSTRGGIVRVIGTGVAGLNKAKEDMKIALVSDANKYFLDVTRIFEDDVYSIEAIVPDNVQFGEYEVFVYNGYGDSTCWSNPHKITVGASPRDSWSNMVFDVTAYGAKGNVENFDDTAAIMSAINAAYENGGGIVYFPKGMYRISATISVPERVRLKGAGRGVAALLFVSADYNPNEIPTAWMSLADNTEISDLAFYGYRVREIFKFNGDIDGSGYTENIYIHDIRTQVYNDTDGQITGAGFNAELLTWGEFRAMLVTEQQKSSTGIKNTWLLNIGVNQYEKYNTTNVQIYGIEHDSDDHANPLLSVYADHCKIYNNILSGAGWMTSCGFAYIFEDCEVERGCKGEIKNTYFARNYFHDTVDNNREMLTTDGSPKIKRDVMQFLGDNPEKLATVTDEVKTYLAGKMAHIPENERAAAVDLEFERIKNRLFYYQKESKEDTYAEMEIFIAQGQGKGQTRYVDGNTKNVLIVNEEFEVAPNRNSTFNMFHKRCSVFVINNIFENGAACGCYGTIVDWVYYGNQFKEHYGQLFNAIDSILWYTSIVNEKVTEPLYVHQTGDYDVKASQTGARPGLILFQQSIVNNTVRGVLVRDNVYYDGSYINMTGNGMNAVSDVVFQDNYTEYGDAALNSLAKNVSYFDGMLIYENEFDNCDNSFDENIIAMEASAENINDMGYQRIIITDDYNPTGAVIFGDVNLDGRCSIKDATVIKLYIKGLYVLAYEEKAEFEARADINKDTAVTLKDANLIRRYLLEGYDAIKDAIN